MKNVSQAVVTAPTALKGKGKAIEVTEPTSRWTNLSIIHVHADEDSHSTFASPRGYWLQDPSPNTPASNSSICFFQPAEADGGSASRDSSTMAALEKDAADRVQTRLLKQVDIL